MLLFPLPLPRLALGGVSKGEGLWSLPLALSWEVPLREQETYAKARGIAARFPVIRNHDGCPSKFQALRKGK